MENFSSCCASKIFAKEMAMTFLFFSLDHTISIVLIGDYNRTLLNFVNGYQCTQYQKKFGYVFVTCASGKNFKDILTKLKMHFTNKYAFELDITSHEKIKFIELYITLLSKNPYQNINMGDGEIVNNSLDGVEIDSKDNLDDISSVEIDISMQFDLNKVPKEDNKTLNDQQKKLTYTLQKGFI
ncbi:hypothetical protein Ahy_A02g008739 [Arachis hypogaea]|uniref:Oxo-4-hydroxy-4-carboxy-5-ureidoimidazoline decarboxylase domain-containing protein n=1 Tax=Arachis hypogaea TaxID=3818 RepID=A0A445EFR4_ARAHY|nr:hypothetical protein Ahy_A02g008739 [Arachis hypogaea]